jgi:hypothetical protein
MGLSVDGEEEYLKKQGTGDKGKEKHGNRVNKG